MEQKYYIPILVTRVFVNLFQQQTDNVLMINEMEVMVDSSGKETKEAKEERKKIQNFIFLMKMPISIGFIT